MQLRLVRYVVAAALLQLVLGSVAAATTTDAVPATESEDATAAHASNGRLRGLLGKITGAASSVESSADAKTPSPVKEIELQWAKKADSKDTSVLVGPVEKINGDEGIVVFHDRSASPAASAESAVVTFDVRSSANCVVSVCGLQRNWYMRYNERCFDLRIAQKSLDASEHGLIRGISAAYSALRPVATKLYLKFDATNFIDGSVCQYELISGSKTVTEEVAELSGGSVALS